MILPQLILELGLIVIAAILMLNVLNFALWVLVTLYRLVTWDWKDWDLWETV